VPPCTYAWEMRPIKPSTAWNCPLLDNKVGGWFAK